MGEEVGLGFGEQLRDPRVGAGAGGDFGLSNKWNGPNVEDAFNKAAPTHSRDTWRKGSTAPAALSPARRRGRVPAVLEKR